MSEKQFTKTGLKKLDPKELDTILTDFGYTLEGAQEFKKKAEKIEHILDLAHQRNLDRIFQVHEVSHLGPAQAVFTGDRAAQFHRRGEDVV